MSYQRSFHTQIAVRYSGSVSYPASQNGGRVSYSGTAYEDVTVCIDVDTAPFDLSIGQCNSSVNLLTGAVVATEGAQVESIRTNARQIGNTIVKGFFSTVRSEITQQIAELSSRIDATLLHLHELSKQCIEKKHQMEADYNRLCSRYAKIFDELDSELKNRIYELDRPAFGFRQTCDDGAKRLLNSDLVGTAAVGGSENTRLEARIEASLAKKRALDTLDITGRFLKRQKTTENILTQCSISDKHDGEYYAPVCYMETTGENGTTRRSVYPSAIIRNTDHDTIAGELADKPWRQANPDDRERLCREFNTEVAAAYNSDDPHTRRVRDCISRLFNNSNPQTL